MLSAPLPATFVAEFLNFENFLAWGLDCYLLRGLFYNLLTVEYLRGHIDNLWRVLILWARGVLAHFWSYYFIFYHSRGQSVSARSHKRLLYEVKFDLNSWFDLVYFALDRLNWSKGVVSLLNGLGFLRFLFFLDQKLLNFLPALVTKNGHSKLKIWNLVMCPSANPVLGVLGESIILWCVFTIVPRDSFLLDGAWTWALLVRIWLRWLLGAFLRWAWALLVFSESVNLFLKKAYVFLLEVLSHDLEQERIERGYRREYLASPFALRKFLHGLLFPQNFPINKGNVIPHILFILHLLVLVSKHALVS